MGCNNAPKLPKPPKRLNLILAFPFFLKTVSCLVLNFTRVCVCMCGVCDFLHMSSIEMLYRKFFQKTKNSLKFIFELGNLDDQDQEQQGEIPWLTVTYQYEDLDWQSLIGCTFVSNPPPRGHLLMCEDVFSCQNWEETCHQYQWQRPRINILWCTGQSL